MADKLPLYMENGEIRQYGVGDTISTAIAPGSGGGGGGSTPVVRDSSSAYFASGTSFAVPFPAGTVAGDIVIVFSTSNREIAATPSGWTRMDHQSGTNTNGGTYIKKVTPADILTGSVTFTTAVSEPAIFNAVSLVGSTVSNVRPVPVSLRSGSGAGSVVVGNPYISSSDLIIGFAGNRGNSINTFSGGAVLTTASNSNSASTSSLTPSGLGYSGTVTFSTAGIGYYIAILGIVGP